MFCVQVNNNDNSRKLAIKMSYFVNLHREILFLVPPLHTEVRGQGQQHRIILGVGINSVSCLVTLQQGGLEPVSSALSTYSAILLS